MRGKAATYAIEWCETIVRCGCLVVVQSDIMVIFLFMGAQPISWWSCAMNLKSAFSDLIESARVALQWLELRWHSSCQGGVTWPDLRQLVSLVLSFLFSPWEVMAGGCETKDKW